MLKGGLENSRPLGGQATSVCSGRPSLALGSLRGPCGLETALRVLAPERRLKSREEVNSRTSRGACSVPTFPDPSLQNSNLKVPTKATQFQG